MNNNLLKNISILHRLGHIFIESNLKSHDINPGHFPFLFALYNKQWLSQEEISCYLSIDKWTTAKALKYLEEKKFIKRVIDENDKRILRVYLLEKWELIKPFLIDYALKWEDIITEWLSNKQKEDLEILLQKVALKAIYYTKEKKHEKF